MKKWSLHVGIGKHLIYPKLGFHVTSLPFGRVLVSSVAPGRLLSRDSIVDYVAGMDKSHTILENCPNNVFI